MWEPIILHKVDHFGGLKFSECACFEFSPWMFTIIKW